MTDRVNLADVAKAAGVHASTASRALNPNTRSVVSAETVARVLETAQRLGYRPNSLARGLRTDKTFTVGIVVPDLENPLFPPLVRGAERALGEEGYSLLVGNTDNDREHTEAVVSTLLDRRVDGLILATAELGSALEDETHTAGTPVVLVNRESASPAIPAIVGDNETGIGLAVDHLVNLGHRTIAHIAGPASLSTGVGRAAAFLHHLERHGLPHDGLVETAEWFGVDPGVAATDALLDRASGITGIVAANDLLALGVLQSAASRGLRVPEDLSVTGYNDMPFVDMVRPPLTTVRVPYRRMGEMAAAVLLALIQDPGSAPSGAQLTPTLTVRASTAPPG